MKGLSQDDKRNLILSVGTHKSFRRLTPIQVAQKIEVSLKSGESIDDLGREISLSRNVIRSFLSLLKLPETIQAIIGWGSDTTTVAFSSGIEIARLEEENSRIVLAKAILENELNLQEVTQVVQINKRSKKSIHDSIEAVLKQRPIIEKRHVIIGEINKPKVIHQASNLGEKEQNEILNNSLRKFGPGQSPYGSKLNGKFFIIVCDDQYYQELNLMGNDIETTVSNILEREINSQG